MEKMVVGLSRLAATENIKMTIVSDENIEALAARGVAIGATLPEAICYALRCAWSPDAGDPTVSSVRVCKRVIELWDEAHPETRRGLAPDAPNYLGFIDAIGTIKHAVETSSTLHDALAHVAIWETDRVVRQALRNSKSGEHGPNGELYDTVFGHLFKQTLEAWNKFQAASEVVAHSSAFVPPSAEAEIEQVRAAAEATIDQLAAALKEALDGWDIARGGSRNAAPRSVVLRTLLPPVRDPYDLLRERIAARFEAMGLSQRFARLLSNQSESNLKEIAIELGMRP